MTTVSIVIPARNEAENLKSFLPRLTAMFPDHEIIVVDDGSTDDTAGVCERNGVTVVSHPYSKGNGAAVKSGARAAGGEILVFMDGDGQHLPEDVSRLLDKLDEGYDMVVGARDPAAHASVGRRIVNKAYNRIAGYMTGHAVADLTSGMRAVRAERFKDFLYLLPNGFSYPTTITMAFFRAGYSVAYLPIDVRVRGGKSHIRPLRDGTRFLLIIFRVASLYSPLKVFFPASAAFFFVGLMYYGYTFTAFGRFTNMSALLFITSVVVFLIGLVSEQITMLIYQRSAK